MVEDDQATADMVRAALELAGHSVVVARDGAEALEALDKQRLDVIILDINMPGIDGWGFARGMRRRGFDVPIVVLSAAPNAGALAAEIGARGFLAKPFVVEQLLEAVG